MKKLLIFLLFISNAVFAGNILTTKGYVAAEKIHVGDKVISPFGSINTVIEIRSMNKDWYRERTNPFNYVLINHQYKFFRDQSVYVGNGDKIYHAFELKKGDTIYDESLKRIKISSLQIIDANKDWIRFTISGDHSYVDDGIVVHNAARFWVGPAGNYNSTNWSTTSGGGGGSAAPTSSDDVTFDGAGANGNTNCTLTVDGNALSLTFTTGYTATITINSNRVLTIAGNFTDQTQHTWTMGNAVSGITINASSTITSNGKTFPGAVIFTGTNTKTISGDWTVSGLLTNSGTTTLTSANNLILSGGFTATGGISGTGTIRLTGGTWTGSSGTVQTAVTFAGNVTLATGSIPYNTGTLTYESGTITVTGSTLSVTNTATLNTNGMSWNIVSITQGTITLNSLLTTATLTFPSGNITFAGTSGFSTATLNDNTVGANTRVLASTVTYTITSSFQCFTSRTGAIASYSASSGGSKAILTLNSGAVCSVMANFTDIDCSAGRTVNTFHGTLSNTTNIFSYTDYGGGISASYLFVQ